MRPAADMPGEATQLGELQRELLNSGRDAHRLHREVEALRDRLSRERMEREDLLAVVSHELRTPLTVIGGYLKLLLTEQAGPLNEEQRRFIEEGRRSVGLLDAFVERVVEGSRSGRSGEVLEVACGPIAPVIEAAGRSFEQQLADRSSTLVLSLTKGLEARFDAGALERVLTNLIGNAIRHAEGGVRIEVATRVTEAQGRALVEISVCDDGPGVAAGDRERIFEPYVQVVRGRSRRGMGLGLAISRRLVEAHGGSIHVEDGTAGGSCFVFTLPCADA